MPNFNRDALRKGSQAINEALASRGSGGDFKPFLSNIFWKNDKDSRYLLFLNPLEEIPEVDLHPYIDCDDGRPHMTMARTDRSIGESTDPIQDQWGYKPRLSGLAIAAELEPVTQVRAGRTKPVGFEVKTQTFERKIRDDNNEDTGEVEEVTIPVVGLVAQSPFNFFNVLAEYDAEEAPIHVTPMKVTRIGQKTNVTYSVVGYDSIKPDLTNLFEHIFDLSFVTDKDALRALLAEAEDAEGQSEDYNVDEAKTTAIGDYLLYRRIEELADEDLYNEILGNITKPAKFQDDKKDEKPSRNKRPSQRRSQQEEDSTESEPEAPAARSRAADEEVSKESPREERLKRLRQRSKDAQKAA